MPEVDLGLTLSSLAQAEYRPQKFQGYCILGERILSAAALTARGHYTNLLQNS